MDKKVFLASLKTLVYFGSIKRDEVREEMLFNLLKDDFSNDEFGKICVDICKTEHLYGKYPEPKLFYDRKKKPEQQVLIAEGLFFIDDTIPEYKPYLIGMSDEDILRVWKWIIKNKEGETVEKSWIVERIKQFNPNYRQAEQITPPCEKVQKLLTGAIKKM